MAKVTQKEFKNFLSNISTSIYTDLIEKFNPIEFDEEIYNDNDFYIYKGDIISDVTCDFFANTYRKTVYIDGNLLVKKMFINDFENSSLVITKDLKTKFFYGKDYFADVGGKIDMEFGDGYCISLHKNDTKASIKPVHDEISSYALLNINIVTADGLKISSKDIVKLIQSETTLFKEK